MLTPLVSSCEAVVGGLIWKGAVNSTSNWLMGLSSAWVKFWVATRSWMVRLLLAGSGGNCVPIKGSLDKSILRLSLELKPSPKRNFLVLVPVEPLLPEFVITIWAL